MRLDASLCSHVKMGNTEMLAAKFESKLVEYGVLLREYDEVEALCKASSWNDRKLNDRLDEIARSIDKVFGPLNTLMRKLAKEIA